MPSELPAEIEAPIDKVLGGFNNKDSELYNSAFGADAVVIDGIAPHRWIGSNAQAPASSPTQRSGCTTSVSRTRPPYATRSYTPQSSELCLRCHFRDALPQA